MKNQSHTWLRHLMVAVLSLSIMISMTPVDAFAADEGEITPTKQRFTVVQYDGNKYNTFFVHEPGVGSFPVYCFNNSLHWPEFGDDNVVSDIYDPRDFSRLTEGLDEKTAAEAQEALRRVLYAGWPNNGAGLYNSETDNFEGLVDFTLDDFNHMLNQWSSDALALAKSKGFDIESLGELKLRADSTMPDRQQEMLIELLNNMYDWFDPSFNEDEIAIMKASANFDCLYSLYICLLSTDDYFDADWVMAIYKESYIPSAHSATQDAIWMIQKHFGIKDNNNPVFETPETLLLYDYAMNPDKYPAIPSKDTYEDAIDTNIKLREASAPESEEAPVVKLSRNPADGKYYSQKLVIHAQRQQANPELPLYDATYNIKYNGELAAQTVTNDEPFRLVLDDAPSAGAGVIEIDSDLRWPSRVYTYGTDKKAPDDMKGYQTMGGLYIRDKKLSTTFNYAVESGSLTLKKVVTDEDSIKAFKNLKFTFNIKLKDYTVEDEDGKPSAGTFNATIYKLDKEGNIIGDARQTTVSCTSNGVVTAELAANEAIHIHELPLGVEYEIEEVNHDNWVHEHTNNTGIITENSIAAAHNEYKYDAVSASLSAEKILLSDGEPIATKAGDYSFEMYPQTEGAPMPGDKDKIEASNTADGKVSFGSISFNRPCEYKYIIRELDTGVPGVTYDERTYIADIKVESDGNGNLVPTVTYLDEEGTAVNAAQFENTYDQSVVSQDFTVEKHIEDNTGSNKTHSLKGYEFTIKPAEENTDKYPSFKGNGKSTTFTSNEAGTATTPTLTFNETWFKEHSDEGEPVVLKYTITETGNMPAGITKDNTVINATVTVSLEETEGEKSILSSTLEYDKTPSFTNTYTTQGKTKLYVDKTFTPTKYKPTPGDKYEFDIISIDGCETAQDITLTVNPDLTFTSSGVELTLTKAGHHDLQIKEKKSNVLGIEDDTSVWIVHINTVDDGKGKLEVTQVEYESPEGAFNSNQADFVNHYVYQAKNAEVKASKQLVGDGAPALTAGEFAFVMTPDNNKNPMPGAAVINNGVPTVTVHNGVGEDAGAISFGSIEFTDEGVYEYTLKEKQGKSNAIDYDTAVWKVKITVEAENNVLKTPVVEYIKGGKTESSAVFTNEYHQQKINRHFTVNKAIEDLAEGGKEHSLAGYQFTIAPAQGEDEGKYPVFAGTQKKSYTMTSDNAGKAVTPNITFDEAWFNENSHNGLPVNLKYTISETGEMPDNITKDDKVVIATVHVSKIINSNGDVVMNSVVMYDGRSAAPTFSNSYTASGDGELVVNKSFTELDYVPAAGTEFEFEVTGGADGAATANDITLTANANGVLVQSGGEMTFSKAGEYDFTIKEKASGITNMTDDTSVWRAHVVVEDDGEGNLEATSIAYTTADGRASADSADFINEYTYDDVKAKLTASKSITGDGAPALTDGLFSFSLTPKDGKDIPMPEGTGDNGKKLAANTANGGVDFGEISYNKAGVYEYLIEEEETTLANVTRDPSIYIAKVTVTSKGTELNNPVVKYYNNIGDEITSAAFNNTYKQGSVSEKLVVSKSIQDNAGGSRNHSLSGYEFTIEPAEGEVTDDYPVFDGTSSKTATVTTNSNGIAKSGNLDFEEAMISGDNGTRTFKYVITETGKPESAGDEITMSKKQVPVEITLTKSKVDATKFNLSTSVKYDGELATEVKFVNEYNASGETTLKIDKSFTPSYYKPAAGDKYVFEVTGATDNITCENVTLTTDGNGGFTKSGGKVTFDKVGEYELTIKEKTGTNEQMNCDDSVWKVNIVVVDGDKDGELKASSVTYKRADGTVVSNEAASFVNRYTYKTVAANLTATKELTGDAAPALKRGQFSFELKALDAENPMPKGATDGKLTVTNGHLDSASDIYFGEIHFNKPGTYKYEVRELDPKVSNIEMDGTRYTVEITVGNTGTELTKPVIKFNDGENDTAAVVFTNEYLQTSVDTTLNAVKVIKDNADGGKEHSVEGYKFTVSPAETADKYPKFTDTESKSCVMTSGLDGKAATPKLSFDEVWFNQYSDNGAPVELSYNITETGMPAGVDSYITKDAKNVEAVITITKLVSYDGTVELKTEVKYDGETDTPVFTNEYNSSGQDELEVIKRFASENYKPSKGESYRFHVEAGDSSLTANDITLTYDGEGGWNKTGGEITFTKAGIFHFIISEVKGSVKSMKYDKTLWNAEVVVTDDGLGTLTADSITYRTSSGKTSDTAAHFINKPKDGDDIDTGDHSSLKLYLAGLIASICGAAALIFGRRKKAGNN